MLASVDGTGFQIRNYTQATLCENCTPIPYQQLHHLNVSYTTGMEMTQIKGNEDLE